MKIIHITGPSRNDSSKIKTVGGLNTFLEELTEVQKKNLDIDVLSLSTELLDKVGKFVGNKDWESVALIGKQVLGTKVADVYHGHDWYCEPVFEYLYTQKNHKLVYTSHLPTRRGFTYKDSKVGWSSKAILENRAIYSANCVTAPSNFTADFLEQEYGLKKSLIKVIPHGVSQSFFSTTKNSLDFNAVKLNITGRLTEQKGIELLIRALPYIHKSFKNVTLFVAGNGPSSVPLKDLVKKLGLQKNVKFLGFLTKQKLIDLYSTSTAMVLASQFEPFGLVGLEAMASGCPVFSLIPSGTEMYLKEWEQSSNYSPRRFAEDLVSYLKQVKSQNYSRQDFRERARGFKWESAAEDYLTIYESLYLKNE